MNWYNKLLASATLVAVPPGGKSAELDPNPKLLHNMNILYCTDMGHTEFSKNRSKVQLQNVVGLLRV
jgi:hypothetical protein